MEAGTVGGVKAWEFGRGRSTREDGLRAASKCPVGDLWWDAAVSLGESVES